MWAKTPHLLVALFLSTIMLFGQVRPAQAQVSESTNLVGGVVDWFKKTFNVKESTESSIDAYTSTGVGLEKHTANTGSSLFNYVNMNIYGVSAIPQDSLSLNQRKELERAIGFGILGDINKGMVAVYTPPASSVTYMADIMKSANIIPAAQAQGLGFSSLDPILETWKAFRNLAYLFFVVAFIIIGFMIMFRVQMGKAAITVQQAIPNILVALLAVTFSYAIAGFMIDIMYVVMYMLASFFSEGPDLINKNIFGLVGLMFKGGDTLGSTQNAIEQFMEDAFSIGVVGEAVAWLSSLVGTVIIGIAILFATFKVFFELVKTYIAVLLSIIFSPIMLMIGAFSGNEVFFKWLKNLAGNLILWPVVLLCILVQRMLTAPIRGLWGSGEALDQSFGGGFLPPFLMGQGQGAIVPVILGIGVLLVIPEIMQQVKKMMGVEDGIFPQLAKDVMSRIKEGTITAPLIGAVAQGTYGGGRAALAHRKDNPDESLLKSIRAGWSGYTRTGDDGAEVNFGGVTGSATKGKEGGKGGFQLGFEKGKQVRVVLDRAADGRLGDAEDLTSMIGDYFKNQK